MVERRCAMVRTVRPFINLCSASCWWENCLFRSIGTQRNDRNVMVRNNNYCCGIITIPWGRCAPSLISAAPPMKMNFFFSSKKCYQKNQNCISAAPPMKMKFFFSSKKCYKKNQNCILFKNDQIRKWSPYYHSQTSLWSFLNQGVAGAHSWHVSCDMTHRWVRASLLAQRCDPPVGHISNLKKKSKLSHNR